MSEERKPLWLWIVALMMAPPVLYVASFGPACWITSRSSPSGDWLLVAYRPLMWTMEDGPAPASDAIVWYSFVGAAKIWGWEVDPDAHIVAFCPQR